MYQKAHSDIHCITAWGPYHPRTTYYPRASVEILFFYILEQLLVQSIAKIMTSVIEGWGWVSNEPIPHLLVIND